MHLLSDLLHVAVVQPGKLPSLVLNPFRCAQESDDGLLSLGSLFRSSLNSVTPSTAAPARLLLFSPHEHQRRNDRAAERRGGTRARHGCAPRWPAGTNARQR